MLRSRSVLLILLASLAFVSCSESGGDEADDAAAERTVEQEGEAASETDTGGTESLLDAERDVVRTAEVTMTVDDVADASAAAVRIAEHEGGFQASSTLDLAAAEPTGSVVLRVPAPSFDTVLRALGGLGDVADQRTGSQDVTGAVVDLEARVAAARASVERVSGFLDRTNNVTELAAVERELLTRESELESLLGQLATVRDQVDLATVTAHFGVEEAPALADDPAPSENIPAPSRALRYGWVVLVNVAKGVAAAGAFALPFAAVAVPLFLGWKVVQRRPRRLAR